MAICEIKEKINHKKIWKLRSVNFPNIFIDIFGLDGGIALTLCLHMPNWDFQPPSAIMLHPKLNRLSYSIEVPPSVEFGSSHMFTSNGNFMGFCSPGFYEYHSTHPDRWELVRNTAEGKISWIIERAISLIDRTKLCGWDV